MCAASSSLCCMCHIVDHTLSGILVMELWWPLRDRYGWNEEWLDADYGVPVEQVSATACISRDDHSQRPG
jgi:hypothetical protein